MTEKKKNEATIKILGCPRCGLGKNPSTHTYGTYRAYRTNNTIILVCKTCKMKLKYNIIA